VLGVIFDEVVAELREISGLLVENVLEVPGLALVVSLVKVLDMLDDSSVLEVADVAVETAVLDWLLG